MSDEIMKLMVRGYTYHAEMFNGAVFDVWSPSKLGRKEARQKLLAFACGDYGDIYTAEDIDRQWVTKGNSPAEE